MENTQLSRLINMENPQSILDEVRTIAFMMFQEFDFDILNHIFKDIGNVQKLRLYDNSTASIWISK